MVHATRQIYLSDKIWYADPMGQRIIIQACRAVRTMDLRRRDDLVSRGVMLGLPLALRCPLQPRSWPQSVTCMTGLCLK